ncbi:MAG: hypothetical protein Q9194_007749 [Teloschistes cf. exilis]
MNRIRGQEGLDRIVMDECHVVMNEQHDFRPRLQELGEFNKAPVPMVMLMTTLPPRKEERFMQRMWLRSSEVQMFRGMRTRTKIQYHTYRIQGRRSGQQESDLLRDIRHAQAQLTGREKLVIYSSRVEDCQALAGCVDGEGYFHDAEDKKGIFGRFGREEGCSSMVATSAFGMGVDVRHMRWVMHVNEPRTLFHYSQESGRAGRDGMRSHALMIRDGMKGSSHERCHVEVKRQLVERYLDARCKRVVLEHYLDGRSDGECCEVGEEACDGCEDVEKWGGEEIRLGEKDAVHGSGTAVSMHAAVRGHISPRAERVVPVISSGTIMARHQEEIRGSADKIAKVGEAFDCIRGRCRYCYITAAEQSNEH